MILTILNLLFISPLFIVPVFFYRRRSRRMVDFCQRMARSENYRKMYSYVLLVFMLMFHATYPQLSSGFYGAVASTILTASFSFPKWTMCLLKGIRESRSVMAIIGFLALVNILGDGMYTLGVTLSFLLLAAVFYPSRAMYDFVKEDIVYSTYEELEEETLKHYFA